MRTKKIQVGINRAKFRRLRKQAGLSQQAASFAAGRSRNHCSLVEMGLHDIPTGLFKRYMILFGAGPLDILSCIDLSPFDREIVERFVRKCKSSGKDPTKTLENIMRFYVLK